MIKPQNFYTRSILFVILSLIGAVISYLLYFVLARIFNLSEFGDYVTIIGLSNQLMGVLLAFSVISVALVKQYGEEEASNKAQVIQKVLIWFFIILSIVVLLTSRWLQDVLNIQEVSSFFVLSLIMLLAVPANIWAGYLQGHKEQVRVAASNVATAIIKLICVVVLATKFGSIGGLWGFGISSFLGLLVLFYLPGKPVPKLKSLFKPLGDAEKSFLYQNKGYLAQAVFVVAGLVFLQNYDLMRVKALFDPSIAGIYGGISVLSNALYFICFLLIWIVLPEFSINNPTNNKRVLHTSYRIIALLTACVIVGGLLFGNLALPILLGDSFANQTNTLIVASLYQISLVSVALYAFYLLILRKRRSILLTSCVLASCVLVPLGFTSSPFAMISSLLGAVILGVAIYAVLFGRDTK